MVHPECLQNPSENVQPQLNLLPAETTRTERRDVNNADRATMASQTEPVREDQETQARPINIYGY